MLNLFIAYLTYCITSKYFCIYFVLILFFMLFCFCFYWFLVQNRNSFCNFFF